MQPGLRGDSYANLSLGNIYFSNLEDRTKYEKHLLHAANFYHEVLKKDDANAFSGTALPAPFSTLNCGDLLTLDQITHIVEGAQNV